MFRRVVLGGNAGLRTAQLTVSASRGLIGTKPSDQPASSKPTPAKSVTDEPIVCPEVLDIGTVPTKFPEKPNENAASLPAVGAIRFPAAVMKAFGGKEVLKGKPAASTALAEFVSACEANPQNHESLMNLAIKVCIAIGEKDDFMGIAERAIKAASVGIVRGSLCGAITQQYDNLVNGAIKVCVALDITDGDFTGIADRAIKAATMGTMGLFDGDSVAFPLESNGAVVGRTVQVLVSESAKYSSKENQDSPFFRHTQVKRFYDGSTHHVVAQLALNNNSLPLLYGASGTGKTMCGISVAAYLNPSGACLRLRCTANIFMVDPAQLLGLDPTRCHCSPVGAVSFRRSGLASTTSKPHTGSQRPRRVRRNET
jgi:hypothetical protein